MTNKLKFALGVFALFPCIANADALDDKIAELTRQKLDKIAQLEQCQKSTKGLKIAGITTLGISTIGIAANIGEAVKIKKLDGELSSIETQKKNLKNKIDAAQAAKKEQERRRAEALLALVAEEDDEGNGNPGGDEGNDETVITPTQRAHHDMCDADEIAQMSNGGLGVKTAWWSESERKCAARTCKDGYYLVLENGVSQGWCRSGCDDGIKTEPYTADGRDSGNACEMDSATITAALEQQRLAAEQAEQQRLAAERAAREEAERLAAAEAERLAAAEAAKSENQLASVNDLDPEIDGLDDAYDGDAEKMTWISKFPYGYITGDATCYSPKEYSIGKNMLDYADVSWKNLTPHQRGIDDDGNDRNLCFCRMTEPATSKWVFMDSGAAAECTSYCASYCAVFANGVDDWLRALFDAIQ